MLGITVITVYLVGGGGGGGVHSITEILANNL